MGGVCCGMADSPDSALARKDLAIQKALRDEDERDRRENNKLLLLGAGESGKSTILKQMRILYGKGYTQEERLALRAVVHSNTLQCIKTLLSAATELSAEISSDAGRAALPVIASIGESAMLDERVGELIADLWADSGIQAVYKERSRFQLMDSAKHYLDRVREIARADYVPTVEDVLKTRVRTSGIIVEEYKIGDVKITIYDVGGQRNERRKWIHCFEDVTAVIFVAAISEYDQVLFEENTQNRLTEALTLFQQVVESRYFENSAIILFLNKRDIFAEKIKTVDIRQANPDPFKAESEPFLFADYTGGCNYELGVNYILQKFLRKKDAAKSKKEIFWQITTATDPSNVQTVLEVVKDTILKHNLKTSGFLE